ncbi:MAG TPA: asparagine synthase-related protein [Thermoanaerobaculia bacterium]|nr:asparagine synthase-related protein [Thermoanaerobaculia bacterium]
MTAIYGLVRWSGGAVETADLNAMADAIRYWGPDGGGAWTAPDRVAALGQRVTHNLPESIREHGPLVAADGSVLTVSARLDNRDELLHELALRSDATESEIVVAAWERWGRATYGHLYGDWVFAAWNPSSRQLYIARDHLGNTALYYHRHVSRFAFASSRKALFALPFVPRRLNELRLAQHLAMWVTDGHATFHEEIFRLPAGHHLTATADGVQVTRYWFPERIAEVRPGGDAIERFLDLYARAVRVRMRTRGPVVSTLSAGLDSTSVTALAARNVESLIAYTAVPRPEAAALTPPGRLVDEWELAHAAAQWIGNVDHRPLRNESITPLASFERSLWLHDEPEYGAANLYWITDLLEQARAAGAGVLLTGQLGNGGVSWAGDQQRVLRGLLRGRWLDAIRGLRAFRQLHRTSLSRAVWWQVIRPLRAKIHGARFRRGWIDPPHDAGLFAPAFAKKVGVFDRMRAEGYDAFRSATREPIAQRMEILLPSISPVGAMWDEVGAAYGLQVRDPTGDVRLLEYCLSLPDDQYVRDGVDRALLRRSMEGLLPPDVVHNRRRGMQGGDLPLRFRADRHATAAALEEIAASPVVRRTMNVDAIRTMGTAVLQKNDATVMDTSFVFARMLLIALFLTREPFEK